MIRPGTRGDFEALRAIERAAFATLEAAGAVTGPVAASTDEDLQRYLDDGLLLVACDENGRPSGFCGGTTVETWLHIGEMDVHPDWQRRGIGRSLMTAMLSEGRARRLLGASLTTDRLAPFNAPFYASLGFAILEKPDCPPRLSAILDAEAAKGADPLRRVAMILAF